MVFSFVETRLFTKLVLDYLSDDEYPGSRKCSCAILNRDQ